eukprot:6303338-Pyramimonas_sp.AAC.1
MLSHRGVGTVATDGGPEVEQQLSRSHERMGIYRRACDAKMPRRRGRCERHCWLAKVASAGADSAVAAE